jgi:hypothetical protein
MNQITFNEAHKFSVSGNVNCIQIPQRMLCCDHVAILDCSPSIESLDLLLQRHLINVNTCSARKVYRISLLNFVRASRGTPCASSSPLASLFPHAAFNDLETFL